MLEAVLLGPSKALSSGMEAGTGADFWFTAVRFHPLWFIWCLLGPDSLIKREGDETTSPASFSVFDVGNKRFSSS